MKSNTFSKKRQEINAWVELPVYLIAIVISLLILLLTLISQDLAMRRELQMTWMDLSETISLEVIS